MVKPRRFTLASINSPASRKITPRSRMSLFVDAMAEDATAPFVTWTPSMAEEAEVVTAPDVTTEPARPEVR